MSKPSKSNTKRGKSSDFDGPPYSPVAVDTHEHLVAALPTIFRRINADPQLGRLLVINPIFVLEDVGFQLSQPLQQHLRATLGFPKCRLKQIHAARNRLRAALATLDDSDDKIPLPKTATERADIVFGRIGVQCAGKAPKALSVEGLKPYLGQHEAIHAMYQAGQLERGTIVFQSRGSYEAHKAGRAHHPWLRNLRFAVGND